MLIRSQKPGTAPLRCAGGVDRRRLGEALRHGRQLRRDARNVTRGDPSDHRKNDGKMWENHRKTIGKP